MHLVESLCQLLYIGQLGEYTTVVGGIVSTPVSS